MATLSGRSARFPPRGLVRWWCVAGGLGCGEDTQGKWNIVPEVRPVAWSSEDGMQEGAFTYAEGAHIHFTSASQMDHAQGVVREDTATLDAHGFWSRVDRTSVPAGDGARWTVAFDPVTARVDEEAEHFHGTGLVDGEVKTRSVYSYERGTRLMREDWEEWTLVGESRVLAAEVSRVFPLSHVVPVGRHGDYFSIVVRELRYSSTGNVVSEVMWAGDASDRPERIEIDRDGDGAVDRTEFYTYESDGRNRVTAINMACPTSACERPERRVEVDLESGRLARLRVYEPTDSAGALGWRSTIHYRWEDHPFAGPTGPHLDIQITSPDDAPLGGFEERVWDETGWTTITYDQTGSVVDVVEVETERVDLPLMWPSG